MKVTTTDLQALSQPLAAFCLDVNARTLRDMANVPRNADGSYDVQALVRWARGRTATAGDLNDADYETLLILTEHCWMASDAQLPAAVDALDGLREKHGDAAMVQFAELVLEQWRSSVKHSAECDNDPAIQRSQEAFERKARLETEQKNALRVVSKCEGCHRIRRGRKWTVAKPPADHAVLIDTCPACMAR